MTRTILFALLLLSALAGLFGGTQSPLSPVFERAGIDGDPNGATAPTTDEGCNGDPDGRPKCVPGQ